MLLTSNPYEQLVVQTPTERRSRFWSFETWDVLWTIACGLVAVAVCFQVGLAYGTLALLCFVLLWWFSMSTSKKGRFNDRRFMTPFWWVAEIRLIIKKGVIWQADSESNVKVAKRKTKSQPAAATSTEEKKRQARSTKRQVVQPFPLEAKAYVDATTKESIGLAYNQGKQTYSMVFTAPGSDIGSRSQLDQYYALKAVADSLKKAALSAGLGGITVGIGMNTRPQDPWKAPRKMLESCSISKLAPSALATGKPKHEYTDEDTMNVALNRLQAELPVITVQSFEVNMMVVITMSETGVQRQANSKADIKQREFRKLPIIKIRDMMLPMLRRSLGPSIRVLDFEGVERYLRMARDAVTLDDYYNEYQDRWLDEQVARQVAKKTGEEVVLPPPVYDRYLPTKNITVGKDYANVDGTWFSVLEMTMFPDKHISASDGAALYQASTPWMSMSIVGKGVNSRLEYEAANQSQSTGKAVLDHMGYENSGARNDRLEQERYERSAQIDDAGVTMDYVVRLATLAPTHELLDSETEDEITRLAGFGPIRLSNRAQQWRKLLTTLTLIDCD